MSEEKMSEERGGGAGGEADSWDGLTAGQSAALSALLTSTTIESAAKRAGVSDRTLHVYLNDPAFKRAYLAARRRMVEQSVGVLQQAATGAVATLVRNLKCGNAPVEVRAAQVILDMAFKGVEMLELEQRLAALEASVEDGKGH